MAGLKSVRGLRSGRAERCALPALGGGGRERERGRAERGDLSRHRQGSTAERERGAKLEPKKKESERRYVTATFAKYNGDSFRRLAFSEFNEAPLGKREREGDGDMGHPPRHR